MDYVKSLEAKNDELQKLLAVAQRKSDYWQSHTERFFYICVSYGINEEISLTTSIDSPLSFIDEFDDTLDRSLTGIIIIRNNGNLIKWTIHITKVNDQWELHFNPSDNGLYVIKHKWLSYEDMVTTIDAYLKSKPWMNEDKDENDGRLY